MRIAIIADWLNPVVSQAVQLLTERDVHLDVIYPEKMLIELANVRVDHDLYLLKSGGDFALSLAGALHALGATTLNPYPTVAMMRNKIIVTRMLQRAGIATPDTFITSNPADLADLLDRGPLIVKPYRGSRGQGIQIVRRTDELANIPTDGPTFAQRYCPPDGPDHKIFCIGERIFGVRRVWPLRTYEDKLGEPFVPGSDLRDIAHRCAEVFGIDLFGMDIVYSGGCPYVVDVNKFGSYMGVPDAPLLLADHIHRAGERAMHGKLAPPVIQRSTSISNGETR